jgi:hypothetical protein
MKKLSIHSIIAVAALFINISCNHSQTIFQENSKDWDEYGDANWEFYNHEMIGSVINGAGFVLTRQSFTDFVLELEFKPDSTINSGVFIRCKNKDINPTDCYELNIWDLHPDQNSRTGSIVSRTSPLAFVQTTNKWNTLKIKVQNNHTLAWINNTLTVDNRDKELSGGYIGLQAKGTGKIIFRHIKILEL